MERRRTSADYQLPLGHAIHEEMLVRRCLDGEAAAWETLVRTYGRQIGRMVRRYAYLKEEAEDLTQEVFLRVYLNLGTFHPGSGKLAHWVRRVGRNLIIDHMRRNHRFKACRGSEPLESLCLSDDRPATAEAKVARNEVSKLVHDRLSLLAPELQQVIVLKYLKEMSYEEISRMLGMPEGTVKSRLFRGRAQLADQLSTQRLQQGATNLPPIL
jgi:RNA polymerase sigma-70 factor (ECF subfamily)